ncbi:V-type ATP synthase subunit I [Youxingia wuxianensis]|uniref:V-type ATP synthase subunit I n=1 Tax=Youxingia wuxianensis TaxID=2763678 RepID=A0A926EPT9_9FIRM|nr:V-type ATPase 116kDa subunit family protein [Youxingia wuxianensis]MBC8586295.1 V-type ATP synthase subunit I [Youxingia wuxianensis]
MSIAKMSLVSLTGGMDVLDDVLMRLYRQGDFHPEQALQYAGARGFEPLSGENPYSGLLSKITEIGLDAGMKLQYEPPKASGQTDARQYSRQYYQDFYNKFNDELTYLNKRRNFLRGEIEQDENALVQLKHIAALEVDFDELFSCEYIKIRFGRLPVDSYPKLNYYKDRMFVFVPFDKDKEYYWGAYFTLEENAPDIDNVFSSLYYERIRVPDFVHGKPEEAFAAIEKELAANRQELEQVKSRLEEIVSQNREEFRLVYSTLKFLNDSFGLRKYAAALGGNFYITGFIPQEKEKAFQEEFKALPGVAAEIKPHDSDKRLQTPTKLKNGWFSKPFEMFVEMYGLPSYTDIDPTGYVAFTYCLLFGIMFGDLGQGLLLVIGGALVWKWKRMNIARVINRIGIFSCIFGALYGSVFGLEHVLDPLYTNLLGLPGKPIEVMDPAMTNVVLVASIALGVVLICSSILVDIYIGLRKKDLERALFSANGVAGFIFYASVLAGGVMLLLKGVNLFHAPYVICLLVLPLTIILFKEPVGKLARGFRLREAKPKDGMGSYLTEGAFELFEVVLSFFSNTMSFLRVGGFVLSHAGMMAVVLTLSEMVGSAGSLLVMIIGNLFVMAMEGLIVGIQVLRLEFYEMFSRYFDGDGVPFTPIAVTPFKNRA